MGKWRDYGSAFNDEFGAQCAGYAYCGLCCCNQLWWARSQGTCAEGFHPLLFNIVSRFGGLYKSSQIKSLNFIMAPWAISFKVDVLEEQAAWLQTGGTACAWQMQSLCTVKCSCKVLGWKAVLTLNALTPICVKQVWPNFNFGAEFYFALCQIK